VSDATIQIHSDSLKITAVSYCRGRSDPGGLSSFRRPGNPLAESRGDSSHDNGIFIDTLQVARGDKLAVAFIANLGRARSGGPAGAAGNWND